MLVFTTTWPELANDISHVYSLGTANLRSKIILQYQTVCNKDTDLYASSYSQITVTVNC